MSFRLFGVNVEVQLFFWVTAVLFGFPFVQSPTAPRGALIAWVLIVFVSVLVHEYGHAFAILRHRIEPEISLHGMGGLTSWRAPLPLGRLDRIVISLAGPFAGFALGGLVYGGAYLAASLGHAPLRFSLGGFVIEQLCWVNIGWGLVNLLPVLPFDGGHVLESALGPKRLRLTAVISGLVGATVTLLAALNGMLWIALLFGLGAYQSFQRWQAAGPTPVAANPFRRAAPAADDALPGELAALLRSARHAIAEEQYGRALSLAQELLGRGAALPPRAACEAFEIVGWAQLLEGRLPEAREALVQARRLGKPDAALTGALLFAEGDLTGARRVLEAARSEGDARKEIAGPLIQILLKQGDVARAAAVAFDIVDALSADDARQMAQIALEAGAYDWSARLYQSIFERDQLPEDAYDAARALSLDGQHERALELLRRAVEAGFSDRARAWSDAALEALRSGPGLEALLPRP